VAHDAITATIEIVTRAIVSTVVLAGTIIKITTNNADLKVATKANEGLGRGQINVLRVDKRPPGMSRDAIDHQGRNANPAYI
jgi:hypothetical protein